MPALRVQAGGALMALHWFAIYTQPLREMSARDELLADKHPMKDHVEVFVPFIVRKLTGHDRGRFAGTTAKRALLPCYMLARFDPDSAPWKTINGTRGVVRVISQGDRPIPVRPDEVDRIQRKCEADGQAKKDAFPTYKGGQAVRIAEGVWSGRLALFVGGSDGMLTLSVDLLGAWRKVQVAEEFVSP